MIQQAPIGKSSCVGILSTVLLLSLATVSRADTAGQTAERDLARQILEATELKGGLIVHLGCGDGRLTAALDAGERYVIHGLDTDADLVRQAREHIRKLGIYGPVSVDRFDGKRLPYADNLVNLMVAEDLGNVPMDEAMRVLAPRGALYAKQDGRWKTTVKPRPENIDEWTHYFHDSSGNAVAHDEVVGPPRYIRWTAEPRYTRSHEHIPSIYAVVSTGGRIFYIADEAPVASIRETPEWQLVARDAFNGILLWKQPIGTWFPHIVNWGQTPRQLQRKLVAVGDRVYVTLGLHAPLCAVDAATGEIVKAYEKTEGTEEIVLHKGTLLLVVRSVTDERVAELAKWAQLLAKWESPLHERESAEPLVKRLRAAEATGEKTVLALDVHTGRLLWKKDGADVSGLRTYSLCAEGDRVFYQSGKDVVCVDLQTGEQQWSAASPPLRLVCDGSIYCADGKTVAALSAETGKTRWTQDVLLCDIRDAFVAGGSLWLGGFKPWQGRESGRRGPAWGPYFATQRDPATGKVLMHVEPENPGHHHRCYQNKATDRYILGGRRGTEFIDLASGEVLWNSWARGVCRYGVMPSNGLLYVPPHACGCYIAAKLTGFNALAAERVEGRGSRVEGPGSRVEGQEPRDEASGLQRGPAYGQIINRQSSIINSSAWPTYRHDAERSGYTPSAVPAELRCRWQVKLGGRLTAPTACDGKVFVATVDDHRVWGIDAETGESIWRFATGARVDSPPTLYEGRAIFGCREGYVYSVRDSDGTLAWRLRAARKDRRIVACGQIESVSPVIGSVLVQDGVAYCTAGRSSYLDGGIDLCRVEPQSGNILSRTEIYSPDPETGKQPKHLAPAFMVGARADILSGDAGHVYLRDTVFDTRGVGLPEGEPHLFTLTDFLDDTWPHRSYWIFGKNCSLSTGCSGRDKNLIYGRLLVFDESTIYGYGRKTVHWSNHLQDGPYRVFAVSRGEGTGQWENSVPVQVRAMILADKVLFLAGLRADPGAGPTGRSENRPAVLMAVSASDGTELAECPLAGSPVFDGMAAANGRLYIALENGQLVCLDDGRLRER